MKSIVVVLVLVCSIFDVSGQTNNRGAGNVKIRLNNGQIQEIKLYEGSHALIVGIDKYRNGWRNLPGVFEDLQEVSKTLKNFNFQSEVVLNVSRSDFLNRMETFINKYGLNPQNQLLIYFAGHGFTEKISDREFGYIVMEDAPLPHKDINVFRQRVVEMSEIESFAKRIKAKHVLFVFDSCFSGFLMKGEGTVPPKYISEMSTKSVRQFITSGTAEQEVPDDSVFRKMFQRGLALEADFNKDKYVTGSELGLFLQQTVSDYTDNSQTPQFRKIRDASLDQGDFIFVPKPVQNQSAELQIISPLDNEEVDINLVVKGKVSDPSAKIFVVVRPLEAPEEFWVQEAAVVSKDGTWRSVIYVGRKTDDFGKRFELVAIANPKVQLERGRRGSLPEAQWSSQIIEVRRKEKPKSK